jgi:hypothetical protein
MDVKIGQNAAMRRPATMTGRIYLEIDGIEGALVAAL